MRFRILALMMLLFGHCPGQTIAEAEALFLKHKIPDALEICEQLAKVDSTSGAANYVMGKIYISVKNYNAALPVLQKAIDIDNDRTYVSAWAHAYLGEYYYHSGDFKKQEAELRQAIELNKTENSVEFAQSQLMGLYTEQRRFTLALPLARHLQQKDIANPEPYLALGEIHKSMGKPDSAVFYLHEAIKLNDDKTWVSGMAHLHLGETYITVGDYKDAAYELNNAIRLNKTSNSVKLARQILDSMNYLSPVESPLLKKLSAPTWVVIEGGNITYNFQDTTGLGPKVQLYIAEHELA